jgi:hypothetical protein
MQSTLVLNGAYCDLVRSQLAAQKASKKKKQKGCLVGNGMPQLLTSKEFVRQVEAFKKVAKDKEVELEQRRVNKVECSTAMTEWKALEEVIKTENKAIHACWQAGRCQGLGRRT